MQKEHDEGLVKHKKKNDRVGKAKRAELLKERRNFTKNIKDGISILNNKLENFDCAIISTNNSNLSNEDNYKRFTKLTYQALDKGYLDFLIKADSKGVERLPKQVEMSPEEVKTSIQCLVDFRGFETLENNITIWAKEYEQLSVLFLPKNGNPVEISLIGDTIYKKEILEFQKFSVCENFITKVLQKDFNFEKAVIVEVPQPVNIMGKWYINSLLKNFDDKNNL